MQIENLKIFCDLAESRSFTSAARINEITQSAVSQQINMLEKHFNALLIERSKKMFRLTKEGQLLYKYSKEMIDSYETLNSRMQSLQNMVSGNIRVSTIYSIGLHTLPPFLKLFLKEFPTVNVHVEYSHADKIREDVLGNVVDLGLVAYPGKDPKLTIIPLVEEPLVLICNPSHTLARQKSVNLSEITGENLVGFHIDIPTRRGIDRVLREKKVNLNPVMEFDNIETVKRAVEIGSGVAIVPEVTVAQEVSLKSLAKVRFRDVNLSRPVAAVYKKTKVLSPALEQFLSILAGK
ncbi:MAG: LysR family transcriptional regulator [Verrucomicrobiales bacterium]|nr:LysR family transcriptional regulator [Verrucomicrobiales bacterium]|tara:strand:+ start:578 stop:1456 length:879 start_codon:yes stop_codon:yes gene_type:complete